MNFRGLLIAVVVLLALGGLLYWSNHRKTAEENVPAKPANTQPVILKMDQAAISQVTITPKGSAPLTLAKDASGTWQITTPQTFHADQDAVDGLLMTLANLQADRVVEEKPSDLHAYGLDAPAVQVEITAKNQNERKLLLGDGTPAGGDTYAMLAGEPRVFTIASYSKESIDKGLNDLRDKRLVTLEADRISRVELARKGQSIEFARIKDGWQILKPKAMRADGNAIDQLLSSVTGARMDLSQAGASDAAKQFASAAPVADVTLTGDHGAQTLDVRKNKDDYYATSSAADGEYKVDASVGQAVDKGLDDFRNKSLFDFGFSEPEKIELHSGAQSWFFTYSGSDWWSNGKKMDGAAVEALVEKLRDLEATSFPDSGFSNPSFEAIVTSRDGKRVEKVHIAKSGSGCIAKREDGPDLYQVDANAISSLTDAASAVKPASGAK
jgi:hypothetical protein